MTSDSSSEEIYDKLVAFLDGTGERPELDGVADDIVAEVEAIEAANEVTRGVDLDMIPDFDEDPAAIALGFRDGPELRRIAGAAIAAARRRAELSAAQLATKVSASGRTISGADVELWENTAWTSLPASLAAAVAGALDVDERDLRIRPKTLVEEVLDAIAALELPVVVTEDADPVRDWTSGRESKLVVGYLDLRVRVVLFDDLHETDNLRKPATLEVAHAILRTAGDTSAVALVIADDGRTTQIVEPADVVDAIAAPTGKPIRFVPARNPLPLELAFREFFERMVPHWDALEGLEAMAESVDWNEVARPHAGAAVAAVVTKRVNIPEKKLAFRSLADHDIEGIVEVISAIAGGLPMEELAALLHDRAELVS